MMLVFEVEFSGARSEDHAVNSIREAIARSGTDIQVGECMITVMNHTTGTAHVRISREPDSDELGHAGLSLTIEGELDYSPFV